MKPTGDAPETKLIQLAVELDDLMRNGPQPLIGVEGVGHKNLERLSIEEVNELKQAQHALTFLESVRLDMERLGILFDNL